MSIQTTNCLTSTRSRIEKNEILCLLGASGCETTLLKAIAGLQPITQGKIYLNGQDLTPCPCRTTQHRFYFSGLCSFPHLTVKENIQFGLDKKVRWKKSKFAKYA